ncbi:MAG: hypothetical protein ABSE75_13525 [Acidimicrobiales bacterium]|jgi:hypothetical protein
MLSLAGWLNPTRIIGLIAYLLSAISCGIAWAGSRGIPRQRKLATVLAVLEAGLFLDMAFSIRLLLHDMLAGDAKMENLYAHRTPLQIAALGALSAAAATGMGLAFQRLRGSAGGIMATCGAILSLCCWCAEVISLHAFDTVLYCQVGGVMLVSLCWVTCALMTGLGILWDFRAARADA